MAPAAAAKPEPMDVDSSLAALVELQQATRQQQKQQASQPLPPRQPALAAQPLPQTVVQPAATPHPPADRQQQGQQAARSSPPAAPEPPVESLSLADLRQAFFDQPVELPALHARLAELEELRKQCVFPDGGALWDGLLARLRRYLALLEGSAQAGAAEQQAFAPRCDLCGRQQAPGAAPPLRRMQLMGARQHLAVCGACAEARRGTLIPLTPTWQLDPVGRAVGTLLWGAHVAGAAACCARRARAGPPVALCSPLLQHEPGGRRPTVQGGRGLPAGGCCLSLQLGCPEVCTRHAACRCQVAHTGACSTHLTPRLSSLPCAQAAWGALMQRAAPAAPAAQPAPGSGGRGRGRKKDAAAAAADAGGGSRPGSAVGHRGKSVSLAPRLLPAAAGQPRAGCCIAQAAGCLCFPCLSCQYRALTLLHADSSRRSRPPAAPGSSSSPRATCSPARALRRASTCPVRGPPCLRLGLPACLPAWHDSARVLGQTGLAPGPCTPASAPHAAASPLLPRAFRSQSVCTGSGWTACRVPRRWQARQTRRARCVSPTPTRAPPGTCHCCAPTVSRAHAPMLLCARQLQIGTAGQPQREKRHACSPARSASCIPLFAPCSPPRL